MNDRSKAHPPSPSPSPTAGLMPLTGLAAYILAGGQSRRFGADKAAVVIDGQPQLVRLADDLARIGCGVSVVTGRPDTYRQLGLRTLVDRRPGLGPLAGLERALEDATASSGPLPWVLVLACDTLDLPSRWLGALCQPACHRLEADSTPRAASEPTSTSPSVYLFGRSPAALASAGERQAPVPRVTAPQALAAGRSDPVLEPAADRWQPFPGLYLPELLPMVRRVLNAEDRSMQRLLAGLRGRIEHVASPPGGIATANTPDQLSRWLEARRRSAPPP